MEYKWDVESDREWNDYLLKSVIKGTGFPSNYIDASNDVDFARTVIMQNQLLVRKIVSDQEVFSETMTNFIKKIYQYEYEKTYKDNNEDNNVKEQETLLQEIVNNLEVKYNPPVTLNLNNINDQINNASQTLDFILQSYFEDQQEENKEDKATRLNFRRKIVERLIPSIDFEEYDELFEKAKMEAKEDILLKKTLSKQEEDFNEFEDDYGMNFGGDNSQDGGDMGGIPDFGDPNMTAPMNSQTNQPMQGTEDLNSMGLPPDNQPIENSQPTQQGNQPTNPQE